MALVNMDQWLSERGLLRPEQGPAAPTPTAPDPNQLAIEALTNEVARQSNLIRELQAALRGALARVPPPPAMPTVRAPKRGRVVRFQRGRVRAPSAPTPAPSSGPTTPAA